MIRRAEPRDAADLARIYNQAMKPGIYATCDVTPVSAGNRLDWLAHHDDSYPAWVSENEAGQIEGWCSINPFAMRPGSTGISETSTYIDENFRFRGLGRQMCVHLLNEGRRLGRQSLISSVFEKNTASIATRLRFGYLPVAVLYEVAWYRGAWENIVWFQKDLSVVDWN
jgi:phosphinothricin acetyltransferase